MHCMNKLTIMESCSGHVTVGIVLSLGDLASSRYFPYGLDIGVSATLSRCLCQCDSCMYTELYINVSTWCSYLSLFQSSVNHFSWDVAISIRRKKKSKSSFVEAYCIMLTSMGGQVLLSTMSVLHVCNFSFLLQRWRLIHHTQEILACLESLE